MVSSADCEGERDMDGCCWVDIYLALFGANAVFSHQDQGTRSERHATRCKIPEHRVEIADAGEAPWSPRCCLRQRMVIGVFAD